MLIKKLQEDFEKDIRLNIIEIIKLGLEYWESDDKDDWMYILNSKTASSRIKEMSDKIIEIISTKIDKAYELGREEERKKLEENIAICDDCGIVFEKSFGQTYKIIDLRNNSEYVGHYCKNCKKDKPNLKVFTDGYRNRF